MQLREQPTPSLGMPHQADDEGLRMQFISLKFKAANKSSRHTNCVCIDMCVCVCARVRVCVSLIALRAPGN